MKEQTHNHVNQKPTESDEGRTKPISAVPGEFVTETSKYASERQVTVYVPPETPKAIVFAGDGQGISKWGRLLANADVPPTMIVGVHRLTDEMQRIHEYSPGF
jgi:hypothetical protein